MGKNNNFEKYLKWFLIVFWLIAFLFVFFSTIPAYGCPKIKNYIEVKQPTKYLKTKNFKLIIDFPYEDKPQRLKYIPIHAFYFEDEKDMNNNVIIFITAQKIERNIFIFDENFKYEIWWVENNKNYFLGDLCLLSNYDIKTKGE